MRFLKKSALWLAAAIAALAYEAPVQAGVIPWVYDAIFGYGTGHGYYGGYGMGYGMPSYGYGAYPVSYAPAVYQTNYAPAYGYADYSYMSGAYLADSCCCDPCATGCATGCGTSDCATSVKSAKPEANPTPVEQSVTPRVPPKDEFRQGEPTRNGTGLQNTNGTNGSQVPESEQVLPENENSPAVRPERGRVEPDNPSGFSPPVQEERPPGMLQVIPREDAIAVRYVTPMTRGSVQAPVTVSQIAHISRASTRQAAVVSAKGSTLSAEAVSRDVKSPRAVPERAVSSR